MEASIVIRTALLSLAGLLTAGYWLMYLAEKRTPLHFLCVTLTVFLMEYLTASGALFLFDAFTIEGTLLLVLAGNVLTSVIFTILGARGRCRRMELEWDMRGDLIPLILLAVGIFLSAGNFTFYGMGQDQGVYQTKAICLMYGETEKKVILDEYDVLETEEQRENYQGAVKNFLAGLDNIHRNEDKYGLPLSEEEHATAAVYHGIPTFSATLALFGTLFGLENMIHLQTLLYLLGTLLIWYTGKNLKLKEWTVALITVLYLLSPQMVWLSKGTLTEMFLSVIVTMGMYLLTNPERENQRWLSALTVVCFGALHLTVYVMIPMYAALYLVMYLWKGDRQYLRAMLVSAGGYLAGLELAFIVNPYYTYGNTKMMFLGPLWAGNIQWFLRGTVLLLLLVTGALYLGKCRGKLLPRILNAKAFPWIFRFIVLGFTALGLVSIFLTKSRTMEYAAVHNGFYNLFWMTGLIILPITLIFMVIKPKELFRSDLGTGLTLMFVYAILFRVSVLQNSQDFLYYYGRYYGAIIPVACVMTGLVWNRFSSKVVGVGLAAGVLAMLPFDLTMVQLQDASKISYRALERVAEEVNKEVEKSEKGTAVIFAPIKASMLYYLPIRAMTEADCFFPEEDLREQITWLERKYDRVLYLTDDLYFPQDMMDMAEILWRDTEKSCEDKRGTGRMPWIPFPYTFTQYETTYTLLNYTDLKQWDAKDLYTMNGTLEDGKLILPPGALQFGPYVDLAEGHYVLTIRGSGLSEAGNVVNRNNGTEHIELLSASYGEEAIVLIFDLDEPSDNVEFITANDGEGMMTVESLTLRKTSFSREE